ncbi:MAG: hypothetical protein IT479_03795 [Xanthomonadales bacterium]|nr:hypothetical protein [Xanthomonadales bacterium]MCC6592375.1 hypothetical protein [Xanthomonadales bacterium]MCE7932391.1 hypothetical protein [Xanthomonadales bacterium PRO6]
MRRRVTHVDPLSAARVLALLLFVQGFVLGALALLLRVAGIDLPLPLTPPPGGNTITLLLWTPLSFGAVGAISGGILAAIYNFVARRFGGIEYEMEKSV